MRYAQTRIFCVGIGVVCRPAVVCDKLHQIVVPFSERRNVVADHDRPVAGPVEEYTQIPLTPAQRHARTVLNTGTPAVFRDQRHVVRSDLAVAVQVAVFDIARPRRGT